MLWLLCLCFTAETVSRLLGQTLRELEAGRVHPLGDSLLSNTVVCFAVDFAVTLYMSLSIRSRKQKQRRKP